MNHTRTEVVVGIFVLIGIVCLGYLALRLGKLEVLGNNGYVLFADFASVAGLKPGDPIEIAGVKIGRVETLALVDDRARLGLRINDGVKLPSILSKLAKPFLPKYHMWFAEKLVRFEGPYGPPGAPEIILELT